MTPEFSRLERLDAIGSAERSVTISAGPDERAALARRFGLAGLDRLEARFAVRAEAAGVHAAGHLDADVIQTCVVTGDPLPVAIHHDFELRFVAESPASDEEIELSEDALDTVFFEGGAIDLGEAAAETLALTLDPYPRSPRAAEVLNDAGVLREDQVERSGGLAGLKQLLERKD